MPDLTPADELRAASARLRVPLALPFEVALADWLEYMAQRYENRLKVAAVVWADAEESVRPDADRFVVRGPDGAKYALAVARAINATTGGQP